MKQWHILQGESQLGPYSYQEMIEMMQRGELFDYHYIWTQGMEAWSMLAEVPDFSRDRLALLIQTQGTGAESFYKRESQRLAVQIPVFAHNHEGFFQGYCTNLSIGGALVNLNSPFILPSQELVIHFCTSKDCPESFKVTALVVRKHVNKQVLHIKTGLQYAVRFIKKQNIAEAFLNGVFKQVN